MSISASRLPFSFAALFGRQRSVENESVAVDEPSNPAARARMIALMSELDAGVAQSNRREGKKQANRGQNRG